MKLAIAVILGLALILIGVPVFAHGHNGHHRDWNHGGNHFARGHLDRNSPDSHQGRHDGRAEKEKPSATPAPSPDPGTGSDPGTIPPDGGKGDTRDSSGKDDTTSVVPTK
jgi:hypothetical protein